MANAIARISNVDVDDQGLAFYLDAVFSGVDVNAGVGAIETGILCRVLFDDQPVAIRAKMGAAVRARGTTMGWTVPTGACTLPAYSKD